MGVFLQFRDDVLVSPGPNSVFLLSPRACLKPQTHKPRCAPTLDQRSCFGSFLPCPWEWLCSHVHECTRLLPPRVLMPRVTGTCQPGFSLTVVRGAGRFISGLLRTRSPAAWSSGLSAFSFSAFVPTTPLPVPSAAHLGSGHRALSCVPVPSSVPALARRMEKAGPPPHLWRVRTQTHGVGLADPATLLPAVRRLSSVRRLCVPHSRPFVPSGRIFSEIGSPS